MPQPDFDCRSFCYKIRSDHFNDEVWLPVTRIFDNDRQRRKVKVSIRVWPCGKHYYVKMKLEDNWAWDGQSWCLWHDDKDGHGTISENSFLTMRDAKEFVRREMDKEPFKGHELWKDTASAESPLPTAWLYKYDGD